MLFARENFCYGRRQLVPLSADQLVPLSANQLVQLTRNAPVDAVPMLDCLRLDLAPDHVDLPQVVDPKIQQVRIALWLAERLCCGGSDHHPAAAQEGQWQKQQPRLRDALTV